MARVGFALLFAVETAMRAGEICALKWKDIQGKVAVVRAEDAGAGKSTIQNRAGKIIRSGRRLVPLSTESRRLLALLPSYQQDGDEEDSVFDLNTRQVDALFRKGRNRAVISDLHFHDSRAEALTRMSKKVDVMTLAKISGHRDLKILLNTYYRESMDGVADLLG
jgi:integrase